MTLLLVSPPSPDREAILAAIRAAGQEAVAADTAAIAAAMLSKPGIELVVIDLAAPDALRFLRKHSGERRRIPIVCVADRRRMHASSEALRLGVVDVVQRPVQQDDLLAAIANAGEFARLGQREEAMAPLREEEPPEGLFGASPAMRDVLGIVRRVAQSRCPVLIVGERGTGREMIARAIHGHGPRRDREFVKVTCSDVTAAQLDQVLDGGAPDGATLYFENISQLAPGLQVRAEARVSHEVPSPRDVRFVAAAPPRIADMIERGLVRRSLVEAFSVIRIDVPPLRQRPEDVPLLATHFLKQACRANDVPAKAFTRGALTLLSGLPWPGNAGELRSLAERLAVLVPRGVVLLEDVLSNVRFDDAHAVGRAHETLKEARDRFERDYVTAVLQHHKGRMGAAARELGIERTNLYRKIKQLNISWTIPD